MPGSERRQSPRWRVDLTVHVRSHGDFSARLKSLSRSGALILAQEPVAVGESVHLHMEIPSSDGVDVLGRILRTKWIEGAHELALMFAPLPPAMAHRLDTFLAAQTSDNLEH